MIEFVTVIINAIAIAIMPISKWAYLTVNVIIVIINMLVVITNISFI